MLWNRGSQVEREALIDMVLAGRRICEVRVDRCSNILDGDALGGHEVPQGLIVQHACNLGRSALTRHKNQSAGPLPR